MSTSRYQSPRVGQTLRTSSLFWADRAIRPAVSWPAWRPTPHYRCRFPKPTSPCSRSTTRESSANVLSRHVLDALAEHLDELDKRKDLAGLVIRSAKPGMFIAGADLKEFVTWLDAPKEEVDRLLPPRAAALRPAVASATTSPSRRSTACASAAGRSWPSGAIAACFTDERENGLRLSRSEARPVSRLGRHGPHAADGRPLERRRAGHRRREHRRRDGRRDGAGERRRRPSAAMRDLLLAAAIRMIRAEQKSRRIPPRPRALGRADRDQRHRARLSRRNGERLHPAANQGPLPGPARRARSDARRGRRRSSKRPARWRPRSLPSCSARRSIGRCSTCSSCTDRNKKDPGVAKGAEPRKIASAGVVGAGVMGQGIAAANVKRGIPVAHSGRRPSSPRPRRAGRAQRSRLQQADQRPRREAGRRARAARERHALRHRALPLRHHHRSDHRKARRQAAAVRPARAAACATTRSCARTRRRFRSRSWPRGWSTPSDSAACTSSTRCGRCRWWK